jgi:hypothetical protein
MIATDITNYPHEPKTTLHTTFVICTMLRSTACAIVLAKFYMAFVLAAEAPVMDGRRLA